MLEQTNHRVTIPGDSKPSCDQTLRFSEMKFLFATSTGETIEISPDSLFERIPKGTSIWIGSALIEDHLIIAISPMGGVFPAINCVSDAIAWYREHINADFSGCVAEVTLGGGKYKLIRESRGLVSTWESNDIGPMNQEVYILLRQALQSAKR